MFEMLEPKESLQAQRWHQLVRATFDLFHPAGGSVARILLPKQEMQVRPLGWEEPLEKEYNFCIIHEWTDYGLFSSGSGSYFFTSLTTLCIILNIFTNIIRKESENSGKAILLC